MTIGSTAPRVILACNGVSTVFPIAIQAYQAIDLEAIHTTAAGIQTVMVLNSDYSMVSGGTLSPPQWTLTTLAASPYPAGDTIQVFINPNQTQQTSYVQGQAFPSAALQANVDRLTQMVQRLQDQVGRTLLAPDGDVSPGMGLPSAIQRALTYQAYDANGNSLCTSALPGTQNTQASLGPILNPRTPAEIAAGVTPINFVYLSGDVRRYGAILNGIADDHIAFQNADLQCQQGGGSIFVARTAGGLATSIGLTVSYLSSLKMEPGAFILYTGAPAIAFLTIGDAAHVAQWQQYENIAVQRQTQSTWASTADIGVLLYNLSNCNFYLNYARGFTIGVKTLPSGGNGFQYNKVFLGQLNNNQYGFVLSGATAGYTNQNTFYGGRFNVNGGTNRGLSRYGVKITSDDATRVMNNNVFYSPDFELNVADLTAGEAIPILLDQAQENHFHEIRDENNSKVGGVGSAGICARVTNGSTENHIQIGYSDYIGYPGIQEQGTAPMTYIEPARDRIFSKPTRIVFDSGPMEQKACFYDGATSLHIPNIGHANINNAGGSPPANQAQSSTASIQTGTQPPFLQYTTAGGGGSYYPSVFVDTSVLKSFLLTKDVLAGFGGAVAINCYDATGALITTASSVLGNSFNVFASSANFGGCFQTSDTTADTYFTVSAAVQLVRVIIPAYAAVLKIRSFQIYAVNSENSAAVWPGYEEVSRGNNIGTAAPTSGTWPVGRTVWNAAPPAAGTLAWVCTTAGTPGTWTGITIP